MESPDVVDTSDVEEREVLAFSEDVNRLAGPAFTSLKRGLLASPQSTIAENDYHQHPGSLLMLVARHNSHHEVENPSPQKRIKVAHNVDSTSADSAYSLSAKICSPASRHPGVAPPQQIPGSPSKYFEERRLMGEGGGRLSVSPTSHRISPPLECDSLFPSLHRPEHSPDTTSPVCSQSLEPCSMSQPILRSPSCSLSTSTDHHSLFSSYSPTTPPRTSQHSPNQSKFAKQRLRSVPSSPLTPVSLAPLSQTLSGSPDPIQLFSPQPPRIQHSLASPSTSPLVAPRRDPSPPAVLPDDSRPFGRYSLRRREARQLNPYAYDKLLYNQQLKFHPDAIVKFRSPRRRPEANGVNGTQDDLGVLRGGPDNDRDYVDAEAECSRRRNKVQGLDQDDDSRIYDPEENQRTGEGWLPETLKELSSSDEGDGEIRKLARRVHRERKKAEAKSRAEVRRIAAEVHKREVENKKLVKRRLKPFPIRGDVHLPQRASLTGPSPPQLFSPARSEPTTIRYSSSSARPTLRPRPQSRASSHSPTPISKSPQSPDFSGYLQEDYLFNNTNYENPFPRSCSPVNHLGTYFGPSSPSGPPTTSGASPLLSNTSAMGSGSDQSSVVEMSSKDRKRLRALKRMMPAAMIARQFKVANATRSQLLLTRITMESSGSEAEEFTAKPGIARVQKGRYTSAEVRGDPESSDMEHPTDAYDGSGRRNATTDTAELLSDGQSIVMVRRAGCSSPRTRPREDDIISLSDSSALGSSPESSGISSSDGEQVHQSLFDRPARCPARERSLIDWMLSRTRSSGSRKSRNKQSTGRRKPRQSGPPRLNIITSGARRHGEQQYQTLLPFIRTDTGSNTGPSTKQSTKHKDRVVQLDQGSGEEPTKQKRKRKGRSGTKQGPLYSISHDLTRITSKHSEAKGWRGRSALMIEHHDEDFRLALDPGWRVEVERWNKPFSPAPHPATNPATKVQTAPRSRLYRRTPPGPQHEIPLPFYFQREEGLPPSAHHQIVVDMNISPLPSGVKFATSSYIGKGLLHQLVLVVSGSSEVVQPMSCDVQGLEIGPATSTAVFSALFGPMCDRLAGALREFVIGDACTMKEWEFVMHTSNQLLSWFAVHAVEDQEFFTLEGALREYSDGLLLVLDPLEVNIFTLAAHWFVVELSARLVTGVKYRRGSADNGHLIRSAKQLIQRLLAIDLQPLFATFPAAEGDIDDISLANRAAELWICLVHLLPSFEMFPETPPAHPLWRLLADLYSESSPTGAEASEDMWHTIFNLCAVSRFSVHGLSTSVSRLPAAWELVAVALKKIILTTNPEAERRLPQRALKKRDDYVSYVVSRCFLLWNRWGWRLDDGIVMFKPLQEIFRSRNFANLLTERSAPMGFFENGDLELLSMHDPHDTVFEVFLKMVVQAVHLLNANVGLDPKQRSMNIKKLLQMAVPVSPVPFSRSTPPSAHSVSMLVNRFSAMAVAIHLDPTSANIKFRVSQAKRCVSFKDADDQSRIACIYGVMNFAMIVRHHKIAGGLEEVLGWLGEMADVLMDEYREGETGFMRKRTITTLIQLLLGSVRRVIETQSLDKGHGRSEYPDPALLDGPWITRVFNPRTDLITIQQTGIEIRMLVQSFLNARLEALPDVQPPPPVHSAESQESQDEYDRLFLDLNDEELLAALGEETEASVVVDLKSKEDALCKVLDKSITPAVYRLVCKHFGDNEHAKAGTVNAKVADEWIDCWVGCANVLVQNNYKDWSLYMKLGQQSWEKIIDDSWRRRVGMRFNFTLLRLDPRAYNKMKDEFIGVLLVATLSYKTTIEHEFISTVLSLDGLRHPLLRGVPLDPMPGTRNYEVNHGDYEAVRERLIETVLGNIARCFRARVDAESQGYIELLVAMLSTMHDIYQELGEEGANYGEFCRRVVRMVSGYAELSTHARVSAVLVQWDGIA